MDFFDIDSALQTDSFLLEDYVQEDEINQIFRKWKQQQMPQQRTESTNHTNPGNTKLTFDSRTYTRPKKKLNQINERESLDCYKIKEMSLESGIDSINLQIGGPLSMTPVSMQRSWLNDVSPPNSICTSMDFSQMANSLITSSDFTNISFLQNNSEDDIKRTFNLDVDVLVNEDDEEDIDISLKNTSDNQINNATFAQLKNSNGSLQLNSTFPQQKNNSTFLQQKNSTFSHQNSTFLQEKNSTFSQQKNSTFTAGNDQQYRDSTFTAVNNNLLDDLLDEDVQSDSEKNKTFDKYSSAAPRTMLNNTFMQSTPVVSNKISSEQDVDLSPITSVNRTKQNNRINRNLTRIVQQNELEAEEDEEFLFEENNDGIAPIHETFNCEMNETNEKEFEEMLNNLTTVKKSNQSDKLIETLKKYSYTNIEKQKKEILNDAVSDSNKIQNDVMLMSTERLLNRRSRLYDDVNLQIALSQKQNEINKSFTSDKSSTTSDSESTSKEKADSVSTSSENIEMAENQHNSDDRFKTIRLSHKEGILNERNRYAKAQEMPEENGDGEDNYRDRFKTIRLSKKIPSVKPEENKTNSKLKSPMGFKSKSCQSLVNNNGNMKLFPTNYSNLMMAPPATQNSYNNQMQNNKRLQTNLRMPRASSLVRPVSTIEQTKIRQSQYPKSVEDICSESSATMRSNTGAVTKLQQPQQSNLQRPSNLRLPSAKTGLSGLPRPTFYSRK